MKREEIVLEMNEIESFLDRVFDTENEDGSLRIIPEPSEELDYINSLQDRLNYLGLLLSKLE